MLTDTTCNLVDQMTMEVDRKHISQHIHVYEDIFYNQHDPIALVVCLEKIGGGRCCHEKNAGFAKETKMFVCEKKLAAKTSGLAVEVGFGHGAGKQNSSINNRTKTQPDDRTHLTCCQNLQLSKVMEPLLLQVM